MLMRSASPSSSDGKTASSSTTAPTDIQSIVYLPRNCRCRSMRSKNHAPISTRMIATTCAGPERPSDGASVSAIMRVDSLLGLLHAATGRELTDQHDQEPEVVVNETNVARRRLSGRAGPDARWNLGHLHAVVDREQQRLGGVHELDGIRTGEEREHMRVERTE